MAIKKKRELIFKVITFYFPRKGKERKSEESNPKTQNNIKFFYFR